MEESVLKSVKQVLGLVEDDIGFDNEIVTHINAAFFIVHQLGATPVVFQIEDDLAKWADAGLGAGIETAVRSYVQLKVRTLWDPATTSFLINLHNDQLAEMGDRINYYSEVGPNGTGY